MLKRKLNGLKLLKLKRKLHDNPDDQPSLKQLGIIESGNGNWLEATTHLTRLTELGVKDGTVFRHLGGAHYKLWSTNKQHFMTGSHLQQSYTAYEECLKFIENSSSPEVLFDVSNVYKGFGAFQGAATLLARIISAFPTFKRLRSVIMSAAIVLSQLNAWRDSLRYLQSIIQEQPPAPFSEEDSLLLFCRTQERAGNTDFAVEGYQKVHEMALAKAAALDHKKVAARGPSRAGRLAFQQWVVDPTTWIEFAKRFECFREYTVALDCLQHAMKLAAAVAPEGEDGAAAADLWAGFDGWWLMARLCVGTGNREAAKQAVERAHAYDPLHVEVRRVLGCWNADWKAFFAVQGQAATKIQSYVRRVAAMTYRRKSIARVIRFQQMIRARQSRDLLRVMRLARRKAEEEAELARQAAALLPIIEAAAAVKLQALARRWLCRDALDGRRVSIREAQRIHREKLVSRIQARWRGRQQCRWVQAYRVELRKKAKIARLEFLVQQAAEAVQKAAAAAQEAQVVTARCVRRHLAAIVMQSAVRCSAGRATVTRLLLILRRKGLFLFALGCTRRAAVTIVQSAMRGRQQRRRYLLAQERRRRRGAAVCIQRYWRGARGRYRVSEIRRVAATRVASLVRGGIVRRALGRQRRIARKLQAIWRGSQLRRQEQEILQTVMLPARRVMPAMPRLRALLPSLPPRLGPSKDTNVAKIPQSQRLSKPLQSRRSPSGRRLRGLPQSPQPSPLTAARSRLAKDGHLPHKLLSNNDAAARGRRPHVPEVQEENEDKEDESMAADVTLTLVDGGETDAQVAAQILAALKVDAACSPDVLSSDAIAEGLARQSARTGALRELVLRGCKTGQDSVQAMMGVLSRQGCVLKRLDLQRTRLSGEHCRSLVAVASRCAGGLAVAELVLVDQPDLGDIGAAAIAQGLGDFFVARWGHLHTLVLRQCAVGHAGAVAIAAALPRCRHLTALDLADNPDIGDAGAAAIGAALRVRRHRRGMIAPLQMLRLRRVGAGDQAAAALAALMGRSPGGGGSGGGTAGEPSSPAVPAGGASESFQLREIDLRDNRIGSAGAGAISKQLARDRRDRPLRLRLASNAIGDRGAWKLFKVARWSAGTGIHMLQIGMKGNPIRNTLLSAFALFEREIVEGLSGVPAMRVESVGQEGTSSSQGKQSMRTALKKRTRFPPIV